MLDYFIPIIALIYLILASYSDIKKREVPDFLSYSLIAIALSSYLIYSIIHKKFSYILYSLLGFGIFFIIAIVMYYTKQWGGGDAKILMGLGALFPLYPSSLLNYFNPNLDLPFLAIIIINIIIMGAIIGLIYLTIKILKNKNKFKEQFEIIYNKKKLARRISSISSLILLLSTILIKILFVKLMLVFFVALILIYPLLLIYIKAGERAAMYFNIPISRLTEGDWIAEDIYYKKRLIYNKSSIGVTKEQINLIKKSRIKKVLVKYGIPFIPIFLISIIISLIYGNLLYFIL